MEGEKQGRLGDLRKMTVLQLQELLHRQEKLLAKQRFLRSLPDGGQKVKEFAARLQQMLSERQGSKQAWSHTVSSDPSLSDPPHSPSSPVSRSQPMGSGESANNTADELSEAIDGLVLSELSAPRMTEKERKVKPSDGGNLETRLPNSYETVIKRSQTPNVIKAPFKPNSSLKISEVNQLPEKLKCKSRLSAGGSGNSATTPESTNIGTTATSTTGKTRSSSSVQEESAVVGPRYKFKGAKEISLQESFLLQRQQQETLEKIQTLHAAERLAERLNIKTGDYNPPALDMQYRSATLDGETIDSDDSAGEEDNDVPD